jgi:AcrR family transcriptional regulator
VLAGLSKPVVYKSFSDRGDLLCALLERCWEDLDAAVQLRLRQARTFDAHVAALVTGYLDEVARQGRVLQVLLTHASGEPALEAARRERHRWAERQWSEFCTDVMRGALDRLRRTHRSAAATSAPTTAPVARPAVPARQA